MPNRYGSLDTARYDPARRNRSDKRAKTKRAQRSTRELTESERFQREEDRDRSRRIVARLADTYTITDDDDNYPDTVHAAARSRTQYTARLTAFTSPDTSGSDLNNAQT